MLKFLYSGTLGNLFAPTPEPIEIVFNAIYEDQAAKVQEIIDTGFDVNTKNSDNNSPLAAAAYYGRTTIIQMLITAGADVNLMCRGGNTALHFASKNGHVMAVELLLENGADKHCANGTGLSPLHVAAVYGWVELRCRFLRGLVLLANHVLTYVLCGIRHRDTIIPMLIAKIDVNMPTIKGDSALHFALRSGHTECAALLLDSRADPSIQNEVCSMCCLGLRDCDAELTIVFLQLHQTPLQQCKTTQQRDEFMKILQDRSIGSLPKARPAPAAVEQPTTQVTAAPAAAAQPATQVAAATAPVPATTAQVPAAAPAYVPSRVSAPPSTASTGTAQSLFAGAGNGAEFDPSAQSSPKKIESKSASSEQKVPQVAGGMAARMLALAREQEATSTEEAAPVVDQAAVASSSSQEQVAN